MAGVDYIKKLFNFRQPETKGEWFAVFIYADNRLSPFKSVLHIFERLKVETSAINASLTHMTDISLMSFQAKIDIKAIGTLIQELESIKSIHRIILRSEADDNELQIGHYKIPTDLLTKSPLSAVLQLGGSFSYASDKFCVIRLTGSFPVLQDMLWILDDGQFGKNHVQRTVMVLVILNKTSSAAAYPFGI